MRFGRGHGYDGAGVSARSAPRRSAAPTGSVRAAAPLCRDPSGGHHRGAETRRAGRSVLDCGNATLDDGYCTVAAIGAPSPTVTKQNSAPIVLITDRGIATRLQRGCCGGRDGDRTARRRADVRVALVGVRRGIHARAMPQVGRGRRVEGGGGCDARGARRVPEGARRRAGRSGRAAKAAARPATAIRRTRRRARTPRRRRADSPKGHCRLRSATSETAGRTGCQIRRRPPQQLTVDDSLSQELIDGRRSGRTRRPYSAARTP